MNKIWFVCLLLILAGCKPVATRSEIAQAIDIDEIIAQSDAYIGNEYNVLGILTVVEAKDCFIPEGCGPPYKLWSSNFKSFIPLSGNIKRSDDENLIVATGKVVQQMTIPIFQVVDYKRVGKIKYRDYLIRKSTDYMESRYGCTCRGPFNCRFRHDKSFGFVRDEGNAYLTVRWIVEKLNDNSITRYDDKYAELWVNPRSGEIIKEIDSIKDFPVCA